MTSLRAEPPLSLKGTLRAEHLELTLVGSAASLLEGDRLTIDLVVEGTVPVVVRSTAAQIAHPCLDGGSTEQHVRLRVCEQSRLWWAVEPLIVAAGGMHTNTLHVELDRTSRAVVQEVLVLGRSGERAPDASLRSAVSVDVDGAPLFEDGLDTSSPGAHGPAGLAGRRVIGTVGAFGWRPVAADGDMTLAGPGAIRRVLRTDAAEPIDVLSTCAASWWHAVCR